jgi:hypothetical protein
LRSLVPGLGVADGLPSLLAKPDFFIILALDKNFRILDGVFGNFFGVGVELLEYWWKKNTFKHLIDHECYRAQC